MNSNTNEIIVIGGGIAGLKAALDLALANNKVILLEAKSRFGGRIYSVMSSDNKTPIELGASYWEGFNDCMFYQKYFSTNNDKTKAKILLLNAADSTLISIDHAQHIQHFLEYYHLAKAILSSAETLGIGKTFQEYIDSIDLQQYSQEKIYWIRRFLENALQHHCTPLALGGFPSFQRDKCDLNEAWNDACADFCFVQGGYDKVIQQILKECELAGVELHLNTPVSKIIDLAEGGVQVETNHTIFKANKVISTLPIGVLKKQAAHLFVPPLAANKLKALNAIGVHDATRVILEFEGEPFWDNSNGPYLYLDSVNLPCLLEFRSAYALCKKAILLTGKYSDVARTLYERYPNNFPRAEQELIAKVISDLRRAFPDKTIPDPIKTWVHCWSHDPFAQGAYPYRTIALNETLQKALESPQGNIFFAGADFSRYGFSVHNAYNNARLVAEAVIESKE